MVYNWCCVAAVCASVVHLLILVQLDPVSCSAEQDQNEAVAMFIFGDSLYDVGANNYINTTADFRANYVPYGESFFYKYPTGRFSDGRLIPDFIVEYVKLPLIPTYLQNPDYKFHRGANFASGGAGALVETHAGLVVDLKTQLVQFNKVEKKLRKELGDEKAKRIISKAVYMLSVGGNDYAAPSSTPYLSHSPQDLVAMVIGNITTVLKGIHSIGGRKFGLVTLPPLGCFPQTRYTAARSNGGCLFESNKLAQIHNNALVKALQKLEMELDGFKYSKFDLYHALLKRINHPSKYGFEEGKKACCGTGAYGGINSCGGQRENKEYYLCKRPAEYIFFDSVHPTQRVYKQLAELMWTGGLDVIQPYNLKDLFHF